MKTIERIYKDIQQFKIDKNIKEGVLIIGNTGSGKTTLSNILVDNPDNHLEVVMFNERLRINPVNKDSSYLAVNHTYSSQTTIPTSFKARINDKDINFFDCPGFEHKKAVSLGDDEKEVTISRIINSCYIQEILKSLQKIKIILVVHEAEIIANKGTLVSTMCDNFKKWFKNEDIANSTLSVITHVSDTKPLPHDIKSYASIHKNDLFTQIYNSSNYVVFPKPIEESKQYRNDDVLKKIQIVIDKVMFCPSPKVQNLLDDKEMRALENLIDECHNDTLSKIQSIEKGLLLFLDDMIGKIDSYHKLHDLEKMIRDIPNTYSTYANEAYDKIKKNNSNKIVNNSNASEFQKIFWEHFQMFMQKLFGYDNKQDFEAITRNFDALSHMSGVYNTSINKKIDENNKQSMSDLTAFLKSLSKIPSSSTNIKSIYNKHETTLSLIGIVIKSGDIVSKIKEYGNVKEIYVLSANSIIFDESIIAKGSNICIVAPRWKVFKQVTIDLSGKEGVAHTQSQAKNGKNVEHNNGTGENGENGQYGDCGGNGGCFIAVGNTIDGGVQDISNNLILNINGGKGGFGQDGGNGGKGGAGKSYIESDIDASMKFKLNAKPPTKTLKKEDLDALGIDKPFFGYKDYTLHIYKHENSKGGRGGDAGKGGQGGKKGDVGIKHLLHVKLGSCDTEAQNGSDGKPGKPGEGGNAGKVIMGIKSPGRILNDSWITVKISDNDDKADIGESGKVPDSTNDAPLTTMSPTKYDREYINGLLRKIKEYYNVLKSDDYSKLGELIYQFEDYETPTVIRHTLGESDNMDLHSYIMPKL